ncbi:MAG: TetR/AcrR family transcriptional regulator [Gammaproteobacteria bacterium]
MRSTVHKPRRRGRIVSPKIVDRRGLVWSDLLAVAGSLMAERGVATISVEQLLLAAGISRGTFYSFCGGKSDLVAAIVIPALEQGTARLEPLGTSPPPRIIPAIVSIYEELWQNHRHALIMIPGVTADAFARIHDAHRAFTDAMSRALERARAGGQLRNDSVEATFRVITRTAVPLLRIYHDHPDGQRLYRESMTALLGRNP